MQPSGEPHLGNYLGALQNWVSDQHEHDSVHCVVDLHAVTVPYDAAELATSTREMFATFLAVGLDPDICTLFVQSHVPEHAEMGWLLACGTSMGELRRMVQFKEKSGRLESGQELVSVGLFTYPTLQAADIILYDADMVPIGDDQRQHVELTRDVAIRFNNRYGDVLVVPEATTPAVGARVMDLQEPTNKMSKSVDSGGTVMLFEDPETIERKFKRAVTDSESEVRFDPDSKPGVANLLSILGAFTDRKPADAAAGYTQ